ncbi:DNA-dependent metalloprotease SPRTN [Genypterus blacodes]|uniref:DNA-dependent metalloprotease SPRTN n=1 Tax=Genypterus blacodes TaxID=154954 RepID=UPI003F758242
MDDDFLLAIQLQEQFNNEYQTPSTSEDNNLVQSSKKRKVEVAGNDIVAVPSWKTVNRPEKPLSIVDASWETLDPSPDVRAMFLEFNDTFFWGKLSGVEVKWSPRMTLCAGVCSYEGRGGLCSIRLSEPLLKLRPRKDLVETLLHEMIHALLFVTQNNRDRDGHGPEFCKHMNRINTATGTKISIYHTFHDEVDAYRQHWWRCNGPCQNRKPYFGYVKRAMNRAPSSLDPWWADHQRTCGGTYTKVKEPEGYGKKGKTGGNKGKAVSEKKPSANGKPASATAGSGLQDIRNIIPFSGKGFLLGGKAQSSTSSPTNTSLSTSASSPVKLLSPFSATKSLASSPPSGLDHPTKGISSTLPSISAGFSGQKTPKKRSVGNTRFFVNINGSPVKIPKPHSSSGTKGNTNQKGLQKSIEDLFSRTNKTKDNREATSPPSSASTSLFSKHPTSLPRTSEPSPSKDNHSTDTSVVLTGTKTKPIQSKYFNGSVTNGNSTSGAVGVNPASRKRPLNDMGNPIILDYFQKTLGSQSAATRDSMKSKSPAMQHKTATTSSPSSSSMQSSAGLHSVPSPSPSSSSSVLVSCPVCQTKVQDSKINEHLDSCLS